MTSKANITKRGDTYTFFVHVTGADGKRRQVSRGGFKTIREAEAARVAMQHSIETGAFVRPERVTVAEFLYDEWLPSRRPPVLEESTWFNYEQKIRLHVVPHIGAVSLQRLTPMDLNRVYRHLLEHGRQPGVPAPRRYPPEVYKRIDKLRAKQMNWSDIAAQLRVEYPEACADVTRNVCSAIWRRAQQQEAPPDVDAAKPELSPRTVRYVHNILHSALKDALRWNRVARNVADAATPPPTASTKPLRPEAWTADELRTFLQFVADSRYLPSWLFLATTGCRRGECLGLRWADLDLERSTAILGHQLVLLNGKIHVKERSKTKRNHLIRLDTGTVAMLRNWRVRQNEMRLLAGAG